MKRILTITSIALFTLILLLATSGMVVSRFIDPNKFKGRISQYVFAKTGQVLVINGNMHWSLFPWIGLKANNLTYYNAPTFTPKIFISAKEMDIKVKVIPLLTGTIEVDNITLGDTVVNLIKNKAGQYNWQTVLKQNKAPIEEAPNSKVNSAIANLSIASLKIKNGILNWHDQQKNSVTTINSLNVNSKSIQFKRPFPLSLQLNLIGDNKKNLALDLHTDVILAPDYKNYSLQNIKLKGEYFIAKKSLDLKATGNLNADLKQQTLQTNFAFALDDLKGKFEVQGTQINSKPNLHGTLSTNRFDLRRLLTSMDDSFSTKNKNALSSLSILTKIDMQNDVLQLTQLHAKVDDSAIVGNLSIAPKSKNFYFNLTADEINLDDYLSGDSASKKDRNLTDQDKHKKPTWKTKGNLKIAKLKSDKLLFTQLSASIDMQDDILRINPVHANFYKGTVDANITVDKQQRNKTSIAINQTIHNMDIKELLHNFSDSDKLSGTTNLVAKLNAVTDDQTKFMSALNGTLQFTLNNGSLQGMDVIYQLSKAHAFIKRLPTPSLSNTKQTTFNSLSSTAIITNGVINTQDLMLTSEYLKVNGKGTANLNTKEIRYRLNALAQPKLAAENNQIGKEITTYQIPIKVTGHLDKPNVNVDFVELTKLFVAKEIQKPIKDQVEKNLNHIKDNLKDKIKDISPSKLFEKLTHSSNEPKERAPVTELTAQDNDEQAQ
jgi:AsmA protein